MKDPTEEQTRNFLAAALMCGETFSDEERRQLAELYADGFSGFSGNNFHVIDVDNRRWFLTPRGKAFLLGEISLDSEV